MATISSPGIGSGLDVTSLVNGLVSAEIDPQTALLDAREEDIDTDISAFGEVLSSLSSVSASLVNLQTMSDFSQRLATSSDDDVLTATASSTADIADYEVQVVNTARAQTNTTVFLGATGDTAIMGGTSGNVTIDISVNGGTATNIAVEAGTTLNGLVSTINNAGAGVTASLITGLAADGITPVANFILTSDNTGEDDDFTIGITGTPIEANPQVNRTLFEGANALTTVTGGVGVTVDIDVNGGGPTSIAVAAGTTLTQLASDITAGVANITATVDTTTTPGSAYLVLTSSADPNDNFTVNITGTPAGPGDEDLNKISLTNDATTKQDLELNDLLTSSAATTVVAAQNAQITVNGAATFYSTSNTLTDNINGVTITVEDTGTADLNITNDTQTVTDNITGFIESLNESFAKIKELTDYNEETQEAAALLGDPTIRGLEYRLRSLLNDPVANLTGDYTSLTKIGVTTNDDGSISLDNSTLQAALDDDFAAVSRLFARGGYASDNAVTVRSVSIANATGTYNLVIDAPYTPGVTLSGTIGGIAATSSDGYLLEGSGDLLGLSVNITGGATGNRGTVTIFEGVGVLFDDLIDSYTDTDTGTINSRIDTLNDQKEDVAEDRSDLALRKLRLEERYFRQFAALDVVLAQLQATSSFLTQQLANLPATNKNNSNS